MTTEGYDNPADAKEFADHVRAVFNDVANKESTTQNDLWEAQHGSAYRPDHLSTDTEAVNEFEHRMRRKLGVATGFFVAAVLRLAKADSTRSVDEWISEIEAEAAAQVPPEGAVPPIAPEGKP